jgi:hypothetical protein
MSGELLRELAARVVQACADPRYERLKRLWHRQNAGLQKAEKVPVHVHLFLTGGHDPQWKELIPERQIVCTDPFERSLELQLRKRLYKYEHIPDDDVILPYVLVGAPRRTDRPRWGVEAVRQRPEDPDGAWKQVAPFADGIDLSRMARPQFDVDLDATARNVDRAKALLANDGIEVIPYGNIGYRSFDHLVALRGADRLMMDLIDRPEQVHALAELICEGTLAFQRQREAAGFCNPTYSWAACRVHYEQLERPADGRWRLADEWAYVSAQTSMGLSPQMFEQFCHRYHERYAAGHPPYRVYYHGCECLDERMDIIARLPNLRRFHVSPWTSARLAAEKLGDRFVLECHVHPAETLMSPDPAYMRRSIREILDAAGDRIIDINLSDIHTVNGHPESLRLWAQIAQELTGG